MLSYLTADLPMHVAGMIGVAALALRNQLRLRAVLLASIFINVLDHGGVLNNPQWDALFWDAVSLLVNLWVLVQLILDRTHIGLCDEELELFRAFGSLSPGEFRQLLKLATWRKTDDTMTLTREGVRPDLLYYVLDGSIRLAKNGRVTELEPQTFIGEVAFLKGRSASATVTIPPGTRYLQWSTATLHRCLDKKQFMRLAVTRLLSADMATKVARA